MVIAQTLLFVREKVDGNMYSLDFNPWERTHESNKLSFHPTKDCYLVYILTH